MSQLCYPYGEGITCVCDGSLRIYKCFPELESDQKQSSNHKIAEASLFKPPHSTKDSTFLDGSTEIVLASTFLLLVILVFFGFVLYRCEKTLLKKRNQSHKGCSSHPSLSYISVSIQTDPVGGGGGQLNHSHTIPRISNGSAKTGLTSLYSLSRNGSITAGYLLPPPPPPRHIIGEQESLLKRGRGLDGSEYTDAELQHNQNMVICHSPEDENDFTESDNGLPSDVGLVEKY